MMLLVPNGLLKKEIISGCATKSEVGQGMGQKGSIGEKLAVYLVARRKLRFAIPKVSFSHVPYS